MDRRLTHMSRARVLVVGDPILDRYWYGATRRISPEAPVPVVLIEQTEERAGGAANVAANTAALGASTTLVGVAGADADGEKLGALCQQLGIRADLVLSPHQATIVKLRVVSQHQQLVRVDFERRSPHDHSEEVLEAVRRRIDACDVVVVSDYAKGSVACVQDVIALARAGAKQVIVDPKGSDFTGYAGASLVTPNLHEFETVAGVCAGERDLVDKGVRLCRELGFGAVLVTRGDAGMSLIRSDGRALHLEAQSRDVFDVTGAGDTVCGVTAVALAAGIELEAAVAMANAAAGIVVGKFGAATVTRAEIERALFDQAGVERGVLTREQLLEERAEARRRGEIIVMTNGCFDILHEGHVRFLEQARALGSRLVVAVNDDESVAALKGRGRPLNPLASRMHVLAALDVVDWVIPFAAPTPRSLIAEVLPDVLVKGGDYAVEAIAGAAEVLAAGGSVMTLDYHAGHSTSALVERLRVGSGEPS